MVNFRKIGGFFILGFIFIFANGLQAQDVAKRFSDFDPDSKVRINHEPLTEILRQTVFPIGRSYRIMGNEKPEQYIGSKINVIKSLSPSRFEGNRMFFHALSEDHVEFFRGYQLGLERLLNRRSLREFNKDEQLAYWLNLYNVIVINKLISEYPISNLKSLRSTKRGKTSFWDENATTVEGVPLSLRDIEKILFANFDSPEVAFGLWQGSIGGPRLPNFAYTGRNVHRTLDLNAAEFVNSNRGLRPPTGSRMKVSKFFEWMLPAFGTEEDHVLMFIRDYAEENFIGNLSGVTSLSFKVYDWQIADVMGGTAHTGAISQLGGILSGKSKVEGSTPAGEGGGGGGIGGLMDFYKMTKSMQAPSFPGIPDQMLNLMLGVVETTRPARTFIMTEECAPGEECVVENPNDGGGGN